MASGRLTITRLSVRNVLGIDESVIDLDTVTVLEGANASTKSSHLKALRSALGIDRTALARLARISDSPGETDEPVVEVLLVGEGREVQVTRKGSGSPEVRERVGEDWRKVPRPVEWLRDLIDVGAANPAVWLASDDEEKARAVLAVMPLEGYDRGAALRAAGLEGFRLPPIPAGLHPLEELEQIEAAVFSGRTEVNRQERAEHDAAAKLLAGLPAEAPADVADRVQKLEGAIATGAADVARREAEDDAAEREAVAAAQNGQAALEGRVAGNFKLAAAKLRRDHDARVAEIRAEAERRIAELLAETNRAVAAQQERGEAEIESGTEAAQRQVDEAHEIRQAARVALEGGLKADVAEAREQLAALRAQQQSYETDRHVRATAAEAEAKARQHEARAAELTRGLEALKRYRLELAEQLPIRGLAVKFDDKGRKSLTLDGVPLNQVNDGRLYELATEVSLLRNRPPGDGRPFLPLVLLDGIERLDPVRRAGLLREIAARGSQVIAACVGADALRALRGKAVIGGEAA